MLRYTTHTAGPCEAAPMGWTAGRIGSRISLLVGVAPWQRGYPVADGGVEALGYDLYLWAWGRPEVLGSLQGLGLTSPVADGGQHADG